MQFLPGTDEQSSRALLDDLPKYRRCENRLQETLGGWDRHIASCRECLSYGVHLCAEGQILDLDIGRARARLDTVTAKLTRTRPRPEPVLPELPIQSPTSHLSSPVARGTP
jgi:hypothetical protein